MRIGIDLGGTKTEGVVLGSHGEELARRRYHTPSAQGYEAILQTIAELVFELTTDLTGDFTVGVCTPGALSQSSGTLKNANTTCINRLCRSKHDSSVGEGIHCRLLARHVGGFCHCHYAVFNQGLGFISIDFVLCS